MLASNRAGRRWLPLLLALACHRLALATAEEAPPAASGKFLRITRDADGQPLSMDTAIVRYVPAEGSEVAVDLVGAIHIGEASYYEALNKALDREQYDVVLYELVAPEGTRVPKGGGQSAHPVALLQNGMKGLLGLESQVARIDYQRDHFVHADMSPEQFEESMRERGDDFLAMFFRMVGQSIAQQSKARVLQQAQGRARPNSDAQLLMAMLNGGRSPKLKQVLAEQFEDLGGAMNALDGPQGSTIITERNKVALGVLRQQLDAGKRRVAIFYGAGHMPDMERRLLAEFGLRRGEERWLPAWDLTRSTAPERGAPAQQSKPDAASGPADNDDSAESAKAE